jgi:hypothetical protein
VTKENGPIIQRYIQVINNESTSLESFHSRNKRVVAVSGVNISERKMHNSSRLVINDRRLAAVKRISVI